MKASNEEKSEEDYDDFRLSTLGKIQNNMRKLGKRVVMIGRMKGPNTNKQLKKIEQLNYELKLKKSIQIGNSKREMMNESRVVNGSGSGGGGGGGYERKMVKKKSRKAMIVVSTRRSSMRGKV